MRIWLAMTLLLLAGVVRAPLVRAAQGELDPQARERRAELEAFEHDLRQARADYVAGLVEHAAWCQAQQLFGRRQEVLRAILALEPDHAEARRELGYRRAKDGSWTEPRAARAPKDHDPEALREEPGRRVALGVALRERVLALVDARGEELEAARRRAVYESLLELVPDDPLLRARLGEVFDRDAWVLAETARGRETRARLRALVRRLLGEAEAGVAPASVSPREAGFALELVGAWRSGDVRVVATTDEAEARRVAAALAAAGPLVGELLALEAHLSPGASVFLLRAPAEGRTWLERHPALDDAQRAYMAQLEGGAVAGVGDFAYWADDVRRRVDGTVRLGLAWLFAGGAGLGLQHGMLSEGLGLYLTRELVGTRLTWFVQPSKYERQEEDRRLRGMLLDPAVNWMDEAHKLLAKPSSPKLQFLVGKPVNQMSTEDLLVAYVAAAYLLEGWPAQTPALVKAIGAGANPQTAFEEHLGYGLEELDARMRRWLGERR